MPQLGTGSLAFAGSSGHTAPPLLLGETESQPAEICPPPTGNFNNAYRKKRPFSRWLKLSPREYFLLSLLVLSLLLVPASLPQGGVDARVLQASNSALGSVERPEENFAGSAFYFIDPAYAVPRNYDTAGFDASGEWGDGFASGLDNPLDEAVSGENGAPVSAHRIRPVSFRGSAIDNSRALQCMTSAIYYEAGLEPTAGQEAVAQVILNRARHPSYPGTVCGVIFQGSERRTGCQFSYTCDGSLRRTPSKFHWKRAGLVAAKALGGRIISPVGTATHYHTTEIYPYWAPSLRFLGTIGAHRFYSWKGSAGRASAFSQAYRGGEPLPAPKPRKYDPASAQSLDPIALEKAYEDAKRKAETEAAKSEKSAAIAADNARRHDLPVPSYQGATKPAYKAPSYSAEAIKKGGEKAFAGQKLPDVSQIKPEYRDAGSWKAKPGS